MDSSTIKSSLRDIIAEDLGSGDVTTSFTPSKLIQGEIRANDDGFVSGLAEIKTLFKFYGVQAKSRFADGAKIRKGNIILTLAGNSSKILPLLRTALNILSRMSGITTLTRKYVKSVGRTRIRILATRKTTPLFRYFEKKAVIAGGGLPHRMGLYDMVLLKHEHVLLFGGDVAAAVIAAKKFKPKCKIEIEVSTIKDAVKAASFRPDIIMLDNMNARQVKDAVNVLRRLGLRKKVKLEVSGGINLKNVSEYAKSGVDYISVGSLTHSPKSLDYSFRVVKILG